MLFPCFSHESRKNEKSEKSCEKVYKKSAEQQLSKVELDCVEVVELVVFVDDVP